MLRFFIINVLMNKWTVFGQVDVIITSTKDAGRIDSVGRPALAWNHSTPLSKFGYNVKEDWIVRALIKARLAAFVYMKSNIDSRNFDLYEIVIASYDGKRIDMRYNGLHTKNFRGVKVLLTDTAYTPYWISCNTTSCSLGEGFSVGLNELLQWHLNLNFHVNDISIMTAFGADGDWILYFGDLEFTKSTSLSFTLTDKKQNESTFNGKSGTGTSVNVHDQTTARNLHRDISTVIKELKVDKTTLTSNIRRRTSARDDRVSATCIGVVGITFIALIIGAIVAMDMSRICIKRKTK